MPFEEGKQYPAECVSAELMDSPRTGTQGIELEFHTVEGNAQYILWLTNRNRDQVNRTLSILGVSNPSDFLQRPDDDDLARLVGAHCNLKMGADKYKGKTTVCVKYINSSKTAVDRERAAAFFRNGSETAVTASEPDDDDVPF
jgi:hypothetical protein